MVQNIVSGHGGFLKVISQPGVGSEFKIYLPIDEEESK
jgi:signal transduction histidine kinase